MTTIDKLNNKHATCNIGLNLVHQSDYGQIENSSPFWYS